MNRGGSNSPFVMVAVQCYPHARRKSQRHSRQRLRSRLGLPLGCREQMRVSQKPEQRILCDIG